MPTLHCTPTVPRSVPTVSNQMGTMQRDPEAAGGAGTCRRCGTPYLAGSDLWWRALAPPVAAWAEARGKAFRWQAACATCHA